MEKGQIHIYTGDGKGKTTAAIGLAIRAAGAGKNVYIGQFIKDMEYHEVSVLRSIKGITVELYGSGDGCFIDRNPAQKDIDAASLPVEKSMLIFWNKNSQKATSEEMDAMAEVCASVAQEIIYSGVPFILGWTEENIPVFESIDR